MPLDAKDDLFAARSADKAGAEPSYNYRLLGTRGLAKSWKERADDNVHAIRLAKQIEREGRGATPDEQEELLRFVGFGASDLANSLFPTQAGAFRRGWEGIGADLTATVTQDEMAALARATQYAHYTPEWIVRAMWRGLRRLGFTGGAVIEPGCGTGLFLALMPEGIASRSSFLGIEACPTTARIAKLIHPESDIAHADFTRTTLKPVFDLAIGNPPFSSRTVRVDDGDVPPMSLHDFFIAKAIDNLRPGGLAAFVVSRYTMDKQDPAARLYIAGRASLLGATRLPAGAMREDAGTDVVVDVLFFRKDDGAGKPAYAVPSVDWFGLGASGAGDVEINRYFVDRPQQVLGDNAITSSQFGPAYTVEPHTTPLTLALGEALEVLPEGIYTSAAGEAAAVEAAPSFVMPEVSVGTAAEGAEIKEGSYFLAATYDRALIASLYEQADDRATGIARRALVKQAAEEKARGEQLFQIIDGKPSLVSVRSPENKVGIYGKHARIIRGLIAIRDAVRATLRAQEANRPWEEHQAALRVAYDSFVKDHGAINLTVRTVTTDPETGEERVTQRRPNLQPFLDDPDCWLVASIATYDIDSGAETPGPIFTQRVIRAPIEPLITSATDALAVTLNERGKVDLDHIASLVARSVDAVKAELGDAIFLDPETKAWQTSDAYLSGAVRTKLAQAQMAAEENPEAFTRNVDALLAVQPEDLKPSDITARLGAPWIPVDVLETFVDTVMGIRTSIIHSPKVSSWTVDQSHFWGKASATSEWGTKRRPAGQLLQDALNSRVPQVHDTEYDANGKKHQVLNPVETEAAKEKLAKIKLAFENWVWRDAERAERLVRLYNDNFNNIVPRVFDGSHLTLPGASNVITLREHQRRAIWRIVADGSTYLAHPVGAGKTFEVIAATMEQRRLGLVTKAMVVVPGHTLAQWATEWMLLYPNARILVADETNFVKEKRARFLARAATDNWDAVIITHSAFKFIASPADFEREIVQETIDNFAGMIASLEDDDRISRKRLERIKEGLEDKLTKLESSKDNMLTIAEIGIDQIVVDEAQGFRKLTFITNMTTLKGIDPDGSQRAWDLFVKSKFVATKNPGRNLVLASGTPVTNTMGELYTVLRFLFEQGLYERHVHEFDAWASSFGDTTTELELQPSGLYRPVTRFAKFVNVPELIAMFRVKADVVLKDEMREMMCLPRLRTGKRQLITAPASLPFKAYQKQLSDRIKVIEARKRPPQKGDDILLSVITDGRHAAIDLRLVGGHENEATNKLNLLIDNAFRIWQETSDREYVVPGTGEPYALRGAAQMIFSDLGTEAAEDKRGFSAYVWIKERLIELGVPASQIAFMQNFKKAEAKHRLFAAVNSGHVRFLIGSSETMGTGVNAQQRLVAMHHLDVPWIPAWIEQREGRIERQGNQNEEIEIIAYATLGSMDATMWQTNERKAKFIAAALGGDKSIRVLDDAGSEIQQFAMAKAIASGDPRLMQLAGLEAEVARLRRLRDAHFDDQHVVAHTVTRSRGEIAFAARRIPDVQADLAQRIETRGDKFAAEIRGTVHTDRVTVAGSLISRLRLMERAQSTDSVVLCKIGGFDIMATGYKKASGWHYVDVTIERTNLSEEIKIHQDQTGTGLLSMIENRIAHMDNDLFNLQYQLERATRVLRDFESRVDLPFEHAAQFAEKEAELLELKRDLANTKEGETPTTAERIAA